MTKQDNTPATTTTTDTPAAPAPNGGNGSVRGWIVTALFVLAVFYTLYLTRELTLPIVLAILLGFLFRPLIIAFGRKRIPAGVAAGVVVISLVSVVVTGGYALSSPVSTWMQKSPEIMRDVERKLRPLREKMREVSKAAQQVEKITNVDQEPKAPAVAVQVPGPSTRAIIFERTQQLVTGAIFMFFLLYFLLSTWDSLIERLAALARGPQGERNLRNIVRGIEHNISRYLGALTLVSLSMGLLTGTLAYLLDLPNPVLWGTLAGLLNFLPYIGPMAMLGVLMIVALLTHDMEHALLVGASYLVLETLEGQLITPFFLGRSLALNPVMIFLGIIFWGWLWGPAGAFLAVPILMTLKIVAAKVDGLKPLVPLLGR